MTLTEAQKKTLDGLKVFTVAYDPTTVVGTPEADALAKGLTVRFRSDTPKLVEVIYS